MMATAVTAKKRYSIHTVSTRLKVVLRKSSNGTYSGLHRHSKGSLVLVLWHWSELTRSQVANYPTGSLDFLSSLKMTKQQSNAINGLRQDALKTPHPLKILVIGAGIGGLATAVSLALKGHKVTVYEQAPQLAEVSIDILSFSRV